MFHGVHFNHDSQNSLSVQKDSWTPTMVDQSFTKLSLPPSPPPHPPLRVPDVCRNLLITLFCLSALW